MVTKERFEIPVGMRRVCRRFERWRKGHKARLPIPEPLWAEAAKAAREHGVFRASKALHLEYGKLKRMAEGGTASVRPPVAQATFLELMPPQTVGLAECLIELEGPRGKMRIQWKGATAPDLAGLSRVLWEPAPIQMCDALSRNTPKGVETLIANCLAHGRRQVVEVVANFPEECRYVLETLGGVYHYDALTREQKLSPEERLRFHQEQSGPLMKGLHEWMEAQLAEHKTEPNSGLGKAISYLLNHWLKLTLFLRQPGAPLDNNIVEAP